MSAAHGTESPALPLPAEGDEAVLLEWTVHLLKRDPARAWVAAAAILGASVLGAALFRSVVFAGVGALLVFSSASEYLLPIHYRITSRRVSARNGITRLEMDWRSVRRVLEGRGALKLSPFGTPSRLDVTRGIVLRLEQDGMPGDRASVLHVVRSCSQEMTQGNA